MGCSLELSPKKLRKASPRPLASDVQPMSSCATQIPGSAILRFSKILINGRRPIEGKAQHRANVIVDASRLNFRRMPGMQDSAGGCGFDGSFNRSRRLNSQGPGDPPDVAEAHGPASQHGLDQGLPASCNAGACRLCWRAAPGRHHRLRELPAAREDARSECSLGRTLKAPLSNMDAQTGGVLVSCQSSLV